MKAIRRPLSICLIAVVSGIVVASMCVKGCGPSNTESVPHTSTPIVKAKESPPSKAATYWHNNLGVALMEEGMGKMVSAYYMEAIREFEAALSLDPEMQPAQINLALAHYYAGFSEPEARARAKQIAEEVLRTDPENPHAHFLVGLIVKNDKPEEALSHFDEVAKVDPVDGAVQFQRGDILFQMQKYQDAVDALGKAVEADPGKLDSRYKYYQALLRAERPQEAKVQLAAFERGGGGKPGTDKIPQDYKYSRRGKYTEGILSPVVDQSESETQKEGEKEGAGEDEPKKIFDEMAGTTGLIFHHNGAASEPDVTKALNGDALPAAWFAANRIKLVSAIGSGIASADYDHDDANDLYAVNANGSCALFHNEGGGHFKDVTTTAGVAGNGKPGMAAAFADYDSDGYPDLLVTTYGGVLLYHNNRNGTFTDVAAKSGIQVPANYWPAWCAFADIDHDADLDIFICGYVDLNSPPSQSSLRFPADFKGLPNLLFRNNSVDRNKTDSPGHKAPLAFTEIGKETKVDGGSARSLGVVFSDFDNDNAVDFVIVNDGQPNQLFHNNRDRTFTNIAKDLGVDIDGRKGGVACGDVNQDGWSDLFVAGGAGSGGVLLTSSREKRFQRVEGFPKISGPSAATGFFDFDKDGDLDLFVASAGGGTHTLVRNDKKQWREVTEESSFITRQAAGPARGAVFADVNGDGSRDITMVVNGGDLRHLRNIAPAGNHWLIVKAAGFYNKDNPQSNLNSIGAKIEVRTLGVWQRCEITAGGGYLSGDSPILTFGLGKNIIVDFIRGLWPSGIRGAQTSLADNYVRLDEPEGEPPSCPFLYVWNGKRFDLVADLIAGGTIGELVSTNHYLPLDPDEYIKIDSDRVRAVGGDYRFSLVNQLPETDYIEQARLFAVDHPADVDVYPNERLLTGPPYPKFKVWAISKSRLPVSAVDGTGQDVLNRIVSRDGVYHADLHPLRWRGFAQRHSVTLDLGSLSQTSGPVLLLHGYTAWGGSSTALGAGQAGVLYETPRLEVRGKNGRWQTAIADMGIPAGLPRTITVPLSGVFPTSDHHVRISTNMKIYWDEIRVGFADSDGRYQPLEVRLVSAQLQRIGYPRRIRTDPVRYDYYDRSPSRDFPVHHGKFTRYGEVRELLANRDDKLAIMNHGEEIQLRFAGERLPRLRRGWKRDFMFYLYGYDKSNDVNSAHSLTVNPLPFFKMSGYPYGADERYPIDTEHLRYQVEYNTRDW